MVALATMLLAIAAARAATIAPLPLVLQRPADGSAATVAAGPVALHVVFFATWCSPCLEEMRSLAELESRWATRGYRLVLIAVPTRQSRDRLVAFAAESRAPGELLFDAEGAAQRAFEVDHLPTHLVLDRNGNVVHRSGSLADGVAAAVERLVSQRGLEEGTHR
jgi:thiol-disulfide isomerase/thioredoxin